MALITPIFERKARGRMIVPALIETRPRMLTFVLDWLTDRGIKPRMSRLFNLIKIPLPVDQLDKLAKLPQVKQISLNRQVRIPESAGMMSSLLDFDFDFDFFETLRDRRTADPEWVPTSEARKFIEADVAKKAGINGEGITVGIIDSDASLRMTHHPQLRTGIFGSKVDASSIKPGLLVDTCGHGGFIVMSSIGYRVKAPNGLICEGVAPGADGYCIKALYTPMGTGDIFDIVRSIERLYEMGIKTMNLSLGSKPQGDYTTDPICQAIEKLPNDVILCSAAGNDGPQSGSIDSPAISPRVIAVGAWDTKEDKLADFSSRGPAPGDIMKPDVVTPGVDIYGGLTSQTAMDMVGDDFPQGFSPLSGSSMSSALCTGFIALLRQANKVNSVQDFLQTVSEKSGIEKNNSEGFGMPKFSWWT